MLINVQPDYFNSTVKLNLLHNILSIQMPEVRFDLFQKIESIKSICAQKFGSESSYVRLFLQTKEGNTICEMNENDRDLGFYTPEDGYSIFVYDSNPNSLTKDLEDLSQIEKYKMSDEDYDKLPNSFRKFKQEYLNNHPPPIIEKPTSKDETNIEADKFNLGARCKLLELNHRGEIKYVGLIPEIGEGYFIGIKLDEPFGKNNGSVKGKSYFECAEGYGLFVRPNKVEQGDFPELDLDDEI